MLYPKIDQVFKENFLKEYVEERNGHVPSGKLSASSLAKPLLWQILKYLQIPTQYETDEYLPFKFQRGHDVEEAFLKRLSGIKSKQREVEYKGCIGLIDAEVETDFGVLPLEVKSVTSMKYKRIIKENDADDQYILQATLYALATEKDKLLISVVNADDYRVTTFLYDVYDKKAEVERIIADYRLAFTNKIIPRFIPKYKWHENVDYQDYPEWSNLTEGQILDKLQRDYPEAYKKWMA